MFVPMPLLHKPRTLLSVLQGLSLTTNLKLCVDAADPASYNGGQKLLDVSGGGHDFFRGVDGSASTDDPTYVVGQPRHWLFDGGDFFTYDTTNETWMENLHKNNAIFSVVAFYYQDAAADAMPLLATAGGAETGMLLRVGSSDTIRINIFDAVGGLALNVGADTQANAAAWNMVGISLNEATGAGGGFFYQNGAYNQVGATDTFNSTYTSPAAGNAAQTMRIGSFGATLASAGQRLDALAILEGGVLSKANMDSIWALMRPRYGI